MNVKDYEKKYPCIKGYFSFSSFNLMQQECMTSLLNTNQSMVVSAPTSSGKTALFELAILKAANTYECFRCVYLAPIKSLCQQKLLDWRTKFSSMNIIQLTGDTTESDVNIIKQANIIIATAQKLDYLTRNCYLNFQINLLLIDEIHMINAQTRGGILEAVITRFLLKWQQLRVIGVSATISNVEDIANWLNVNKNNVKEFGQQYRPVNVKKIVLGYRPSKNSYIFQRALNNKLDEIVRRYSQQKPCLIFCQTQKGTVSACQYLIQALPRNYLITSQTQSNSLNKCSKSISQKTLGHIMTSGVAYHNASLSTQDRNIIIQQFIQQNIKIICTTSTLSQGMNLPARLVIIKGTLAYRGAARGYNEYTGIELQQMMGRAGRVGYDVEGTAVVMTQNSNVSKYSKQLIKQNLESNLYQLIKQHINVEISLRNIRKLQDGISYLKKTFYYIRMKKQPRRYGVNSQSQCQLFITNIVQQTIKQLLHYQLICQINGQIMPLELCAQLSKSSISFSTTKHLLDSLLSIKSFEAFLLTICGATQIQKYRSKLDQRKCLKQLNSLNRYKIKDTIGTPTKKAFVLVQAYLSKYNINQWQLNRQAIQIITIVKNATYIFRSILKTKKIFLLSYYSISLLRYLNKQCWNFPEDLILKNLPCLKDRHEIMRIHNIYNMNSLLQKIKDRNLSLLCHQPDTFNDYILDSINNYSKLEVISENKDQMKQITLKYDIKFSNQMKHFTAIIGSTQQVYIIMQSKLKQKQIKVYLKKYQYPLKIAVIFENTIGFDKVFIAEKQDIWKEAGGLDHDVREVQKQLKDYVIGQSGSKNNNLKKVTEKRKKPNSKIQKLQKSEESQQQSQSQQSISKQKTNQSFHTPNPKKDKYQTNLIYKTNKKNYLNKYIRSNPRGNKQTGQQIHLHADIEEPQLQVSPISSIIKPCIIEDEIIGDVTFEEYSYKGKSNKQDRRIGNNIQKKGNPYMPIIQSNSAKTLEINKQLVASITNSSRKEGGNTLLQKFKRLTTSDLGNLKVAANQYSTFDELYDNL